VLRQIVIEAGRPLLIEAVDQRGRVDCFRLNGVVLQVKYSTKRLPPWQFTLSPDQLSELEALRRQTGSAWVVCVCGVDGIVALNWDEVTQVVDIASTDVGWIRVSRSRSTLYRVAGSAGELVYRKPKGVRALLTSAVGDDYGNGGGR
jgi:hypothetical protein